jgi:ribosomal-protein-serine acetyltransferase
VLAALLRHPLHDGAYLRLAGPRDAEEMHAVVAANREYLARWLPWAAEATVESTREFLAATGRQLAEGDGLQTAIVADGRIAGMVGFHEVSWLHGTTSIGYWLAEAQQGRGLMTAAVRAYLDHAFGACGLQRVELRAAVDNARSRAVAERLGFAEEGVARRSERVGDRHLDLVVYAMLAGAWAS